MNFQALQYFIVAAECENFTKAAEKCYITQTAMSMQISKMEKELGFKLFDRDRQRVRLTTSGESFYRSARQIIDEFEQAVEQGQNMQQGEAGRVCAGISSGIEMLRVMPMLHAFKQKYPDVDLVLEQVRPRELEEQLACRHLDLAFCWGHEIRPIAGMETVEVYSSPVCVVMGGEHPLSREVEISPDLLKDQTAVMIEWRKPSDPYYRLNAAWRALGVEPLKTIMVSNLEEELAMLQLREAVAIAPNYVRNLALGGTLAYRPISMEGISSEIIHEVDAIARDDRSPAVSLLVKFIIEEHQKYSL